jgi:hypothetical protein
VTERSAALAVSTLAALVSAVPAVPRLGGQSANTAFGLLALWGGTALVLGPALVLAAAARRDATGYRAPLLGLALSAGPLAVLAESLKHGTHHRPLGAATFAILALVTIAGAILVAWRLLRFAESRSSTLSRVVGGAMLLAASASVGLVLVRALGSPSLVPHVLDGLRAVAAATLGHLLLHLPKVMSVARRVGVPLWVLVVVAGVVANRGATALAVRSAVPVLGGPLAWF